MKCIKIIEYQRDANVQTQKFKMLTLSFLLKTHLLKKQNTTGSAKAHSSFHLPFLTLNFPISYVIPITYFLNTLVFMQFAFFTQQIL